MKEMATLNRKEQKRLMVLNEVGVGEMTGVGASQILSLEHWLEILDIKT